VRGIIGRAAAWTRRRRRHDWSWSALLLRELPAQVARKGTRAALDAVNRVAVTPRRAPAWGAELRQALARAGAGAHVLVAVPGLLQFAIPCLALATRRVGVIVVHNGTRPWEADLLRERFPALPVVHLRPAWRSILPHGVVLDVLLRHADRELALLDPDLFAFEPTVFDRLALAPGEIAAGAFGFTNRRSGLTFPTTHLLRLDPLALQALMERHRVGATIYRRTPPALVPPLRSIGIGDHNFVKDYLAYYDPLNLLLAIAVHDGHRLRVAGVEEHEAVHVGGVSYADRGGHLDHFNARLLELPFARPFAARYRASLGVPASAAASRARLVEHGATAIAEWIDRTVDRLAAALGRS
jgi:hypothetical protein